MTNVFEKIVDKFDFINKLIFNFISQIILQSQAIKRVSCLSYFKKVWESKAVNFLLKMYVFKPEGVYCIASFIIILEILKEE